MVVLRVGAGLIGLVLMLAGVVTFFYGVFSVFSAFVSEEGDLGIAIVAVVVGILICSLATVLGKFARGPSHA